MLQYQVSGLLNEAAAETSHDEVAQYFIGKLGQGIIHSLEGDFTPIPLALQSRGHFDKRRGSEMIRMLSWSSKMALIRSEPGSRRYRLTRALVSKK
jgi:hypothetical protein